MQIGAIGYPTFVYNTNYVSSRSLGRVSAVPKDALAGKIGYSGAENSNPLRLGESKDLVGILASQMAMGRLNAARVMKEPVAEQAEEGIESVQSRQDTPGAQDVQGLMDAQDTIDMAMMGA